VARVELDNGHQANVAKAVGRVPWERHDWNRRRAVGRQFDELFCGYQRRPSVRERAPKRLVWGRRLATTHDPLRIVIHSPNIVTLRKNLAGGKCSCDRGIATPFAKRRFVHRPVQSRTSEAPKDRLRRGRCWSRFDLGAPGRIATPRTDPRVVGAVGRKPLYPEGYRGFESLSRQQLDRAPASFGGQASEPGPLISPTAFQSHARRRVPASYFLGKVPVVILQATRLVGSHIDNFT